MKLLINNEEISITLESEKTAGEIFSHIQKEFSGKDKQISAMRINGIYTDFQKAKDMEIENIQEIHFDIVSPGQLLLDSIIEISNYLTRVLTFFDNHPQYKKFNDMNETEKINLKEGICWLNDSVEAITSSDPGIIKIVHKQFYAPNGEERDPSEGHDPCEGGKNITAILKEFQDYLQKNNPQANLSLNQVKNLCVAFKAGFNDVLILLKNVTPNEENILSTLAEFLKKIPMIIEKLSLISGFLHEGKDSDAFVKINQVMAELEGYLLLIPALEQSGISIQVSLSSEIATNLLELNKKFIEMLHQLADSMENNDSVSITDLCEYEIPEALELLPEAFGQIQSHFN